MHILTGMFGIERGGSERALMRLGEAWQEAGHRVSLVPRIANGRFAPRKLAAELAGMTVREKPDIVFSAGQTYALVMALLARKLGDGRPPIAAKISNSPRHAARGGFGVPASYWLRRQVRWTDMFIAPDEASARELIDGGLPEARLKVIPNPAASAAALEKLAHRTANDSSSLRLLSIGRLVPQKNFALLIEAFARTARSGDRLTIVGEGPLRRRLQEQAARTGTDIRFAGWMNDPAHAYADANAFALASDFEGLPAVLVEALAAGLPIAATNSAPGLADLLGGGKYGHIVPVRRAGELANAIDRLRNFQPKAEDMLAQAMKFTVEAAAPVYIGAFESLVRRQRSAN